LDRWILKNHTFWIAITLYLYLKAKEISRARYWFLSYEWSLEVREYVLYKS
jgi:hypothetical protein